MPTPTVLDSTHASANLKRGFDKLANLLAVTLGPTQGHVLVARELDGKPELLTDAATIARRTLQLPDRAEDVGAMLARNLAWRVQQRAGDGSATALVLAQAILDEAHRYKAAGGNVMVLRRGIERGARAAVDALRDMARLPETEEEIGLVALTVTGDPVLSRTLGEMYHRLGADAYITIEDYLAPYLERVYLEGGRWPARLASPYFITDAGAQRAIQQGCPVALCAESLSTLEDVRPLLELVAQTEGKRVAVVANDILGDALAALVMNHQQGAVQVIGIELRNAEPKRRADFEDLAALTGARLFAPEYGRSLRRITLNDLGMLRQVEASADEAMFMGDGSRSDAIERHLATLEARLARLPDTDEGRDDVRLRKARLAGQSALLMIGAYTDVERAAIRQRAERALRALPLALREGIALGGGVAYLNCVPAVRAVQVEGEEAWGVEIVARALEAPFRRLAQNAGVASPSVVLAEARRLGPTYGYVPDAEAVLSLEEEGLYDAVGVLRHAFETAVSGAMMALTVDTIILHRSPQTSYEP